MALSTYSELKTSVANWLRRPDLTDAIPDFITLAEAQMNRRLRVRPMVARATATLTDEYSAAPDDFLAPIVFVLDRDPVVELEYVSPERIPYLQSIDWSNTGDVPNYYSIVGAEYRFFPAPTTPYTGLLTYYQKLPALSDSNASNWLLESHPDAYLYGALLQSAPYLRSDERMATWAGLYQAALDDVKANYHVSNTTQLRMDGMPVSRRYRDDNRDFF